MMNKHMLEKLAAFELRATAYHEVGHKIIYEHFGGAGDAVLWRNDSGNASERAWLGHFQPCVCPMQMLGRGTESARLAQVLLGN